MNLVKFIENRYQELTLEVQSNADAFEIHKDAEIKASHQILSFYRALLMWAMIPKVLFNFIQMKLGLKDEPQPVILNKMKADMEAQKAADKLKKESHNITELHHGP